MLAPRAVGGPVTLVGHSLGARLAVAYAARYPRDVARLVLVSLPYFGDEEQAKQFIRSRHSSGWLWTHMIPFALSCLLGRRLLGWASPLLAGVVPRAVAEDLNQMTWRSSSMESANLHHSPAGCDSCFRVNDDPPAGAQ